MKPHTNRFQFSRSAAAVLGLLVLAAPARADSYGSTVTHVATTRIEVESNGSSYHRTNPLANLVADVRVEVSTGAVGSVKSWNVYLGLASEDGERMWFQSFGKCKSYPWYDRPGSVGLGRLCADALQRAGRQAARPGQGQHGNLRTRPKV